MLTKQLKAETIDTDMKMLRIKSQSLLYDVSCFGVLSLISFKCLQLLGGLKLTGVITSQMGCSQSNFTMSNFTGQNIASSSSKGSLWFPGQSSTLQVLVRAEPCVGCFGWFYNLHQFQFQWLS